jgi:hypothetical protein
VASVRNSIVSELLEPEWNNPTANKDATLRACHKITYRTVNATAGINIPHNLVVNATDRSGNSNTSKNIQLTVLRRGDVFRDNVVDMKDAVYIARYLAGLEPAVPNFVLVSDVVGESGSIGDGVGNMKDGVYLARYLAGLEDEP